MRSNKVLRPSLMCWKLIYQCWKRWSQKMLLLQLALVHVIAVVESCMVNQIMNAWSMNFIIFIFYFCLEKNILLSHRCYFIQEQKETNKNYHIIFMKLKNVTRSLRSLIPSAVYFSPLTRSHKFLHLFIYFLI